MLLVLPLLLTTVYAVPINNGTTQAKDFPPVKKCFYEGKNYPAGAIISSGRSIDWCFGTYCDLDGMVKHWDNYNCDGSSLQGPSGKVHQLHTAPEPKPTTPAPPITTTVDYFGRYGCWFRNRFYWSGEDIETIRRGYWCSGKYCDWDGKIQSWEDDCRYVMPGDSHSVHDFS